MWPTPATGREAGLLGAGPKNKLRALHQLRTNHSMIMVLKHSAVRSYSKQLTLAIRSSLLKSSVRMETLQCSAAKWCSITSANLETGYDKMVQVLSLVWTTSLYTYSTTDGLDSQLVHASQRVGTPCDG
jgi:hypothetical protein